MAESQSVAKQALKKLEDQLTCAVCLDAFKDPKLLQCFHVYCKDCLQRLVVTDRQGQLSLCCPTCRQSTLLPPATSVSDLQPAFHIHHLIEIQDALEKVKEPQKVLCTKCNKNRSATSYCRDCGKYICSLCTTIHDDWDDFAGHEVVALEQLESKVKQLDSLKKVVLYCSLHKGKELELYCETCEELICHNCTVKKHKDHQYDLVDDTFEKHKAEIVASLGPIENQLGITHEALQKIKQRSGDVNEQRVGTKTEIKKVIQQLYEMLEAHKTELMGKVDEYADQKIKNLAAQKDEVETVQTQLASCLSFVRESLRTGSQGEVMKMKKVVMKQIKEMTGNFKPDMLPPCEHANVKFVALPELIQICQKFGDVYQYSSHVYPEICYATGKGLEVAKLGDRATAVLHIVDQKGKAYSTPVLTLTCKLIQESTGEKIDCTVKKIEASGQYEIGHQATSRGRHQLHIKVEGKHIKGSPFPIIVKLPVNKLGTPVKIISRLKKPWGVAVNQKGKIFVAERHGHCISIFSPTGEKLGSFGSHGSGPGYFSEPHGLTLDDDGNILVADANNNRIQKFTSNNKHIVSIRSCTSNHLQFSHPLSVSISPITKKIAISDCYNHRIQIFNPDLTFHSSIGSKGSGNGQFNRPHDTAFDSVGNIYVCDACNHRIQVFNPEGQFLRWFGNRGNGNGELEWPAGISIDSDDTVYVAEDCNHRVSIFTHEGKFLASFGSWGSGPGQFKHPCEIIVDKYGTVYVADSFNDRIQTF